jgi:hypothetical protein
MDPQLINQLRQALRKNGITVQTDVKSYAQSLGLQTGRAQPATSAAPQVEPKATSTAPPVGSEAPTAATSAPSQFTQLQQQLTQLIDNKLPEPLVPFKLKFSNKVKTVSTYPELKVFETDLMDIIEKARKAQQADPKAAQAVTQSVDMAIKQAEKTQAPPSNLSQVTSKFKDEANASLESKVKSLAFGQAHPNLRLYTYKSYEPVDVTSPIQVGTDRADVVGLPRTDGKELLALGFNVRRTQTFWTGDNGRIAEQYLSHLFVIQKGEDVVTIEPAIKQVDGAIKRGIISLPLS